MLTVEVGPHEIRLASPDDRTLSPQEQTTTSQEKTSSATSDKQSSSSRSIYNMPPAQFVPGQHAIPDVSPMEPDFQGFPTSAGPHPKHHGHASHGSLVFAGFPSSNNSSPAPPLSAGGMSQYPFPHPSQSMHPHSNGFQVMPPPGFGFPQQPNNHMMHSSGLDNFGRRHPVPFAPPEGYSPSVTPGISENHRPLFYDPSTPHSFHSHSSPSREQDIHALQSFTPNIQVAMTNGSNGHVDDVKLYHQHQSHTRSGSSLPAILQAPAMDNLDGLLGYIQSQFANPTMADYVLEIRYTDKRASPLRIPGHNLIFARSPALKRLMLDVAQTSAGGDEAAPRTILIESNDRFLRTDGCWIALQRLYGGPLLNPDILPDPAEAQRSVTSPGNLDTDKFGLALGYAAAGQILQIPPVLNRGVEVASRFINWSTLEKALDFALDGGLSTQWTLENTFDGICPSTYGPAVDMLIHAALNFLITNFPPHLDFDQNVPDPKHNRRLPAVDEGKAAKHNPRLSSIKFGDHSIEESIHATYNGTNLSAVISRVLVNLPFQLLKYVLESPSLGNVGDWATVALRRSVMHDVVNERERRRSRVCNECKVPNSVRIANPNEWQAVGWQETVGSDPARKIPTLTRTWVDFKLPE